MMRKSVPAANPDAYVAALDGWRRACVEELRAAVRGASVPGPLPTDSAELLHGLDHFRHMCEVCHGAPGVERGEIGAGLNPRPPHLHRAAGQWSDAELFWITKHGIKATGMPAFGDTHDDASLLQIVAAVRRIESMTESEYIDWVTRLQASDLGGHQAAGPTPMGQDGTGAPDEGGGHSHAPGSPSHSH